VPESKPPSSGFQPPSPPTAKELLQLQAASMFGAQQMVNYAGATRPNWVVSRGQIFWLVGTSYVGGPQAKGKHDAFLKRRAKYRQQKAKSTGE
jgi:hypothetical protein